MGAPHRDDAHQARADEPLSTGTGDALGPASNRLRLRLAYAVLTLLVIALVLAAGGAPVAIRAPVVLLAATVVPGFPLVARLPLTLPAVLALAACLSLALEAGLAFALVQTRFWHPHALGLALSGAAAGGTLVAISALRRDIARGHL